MNIILLDSLQDEVALSSDDYRAIHIQEVLRMTVGDELFVGVINGPKGKAVIQCLDSKGIQLSVNWGQIQDTFLPVDLIIGLSRPQTMRKILQECTSLGARKIVFFGAEKGETSYFESKLWKEEQWRKYVRLGMEQAFVTIEPEIKVVNSLSDALKLTKAKGLALDNYEATSSLHEALSGRNTNEFALAIGSERGWSGLERDLLREQGYELAHLGERVLRTETAAIVGLGALAYLSV